MEPKDFCRAWLVIRSDNLDHAALSSATGLPERKPNSLGKVPKANALTIQSDAEISEELGMQEHIAWLSSKINENETLLRFLKEGECSTELFLYTSTDQEAAYTEVPAETLRFVAELGCDLVVKVETSS